MITIMLNHCYNLFLDAPSLAQSFTDAVVSPNRSFSFPFTVDANPPTANMLGRGGTEPVPASITVTEDMVIIDNPDTNDGGTYQLIATNYLGRAMFNFVVTVECKCSLIKDLATTMV